MPQKPEHSQLNDAAKFCYHVLTLTCVTAVMKRIFNYVANVNCCSLLDLLVSRDEEATTSEEIVRPNPSRTWKWFGFWSSNFFKYLRHNYRRAAAANERITSRARVLGCVLLSTEQTKNSPPARRKLNLCVFLPVPRALARSNVYLVKFPATQTELYLNIWWCNTAL
jgi:hypothetical protein